MKKLTIFMILLILSVSLFAGVGGGYSLYPVGERVGDESFGGAGVSAFFSPTGIKNIGKMEVAALFAMKSPFFRGVDAKISTPVFQSVDHPFNYVFSNKVLWQPTIAIGAQYRVGNEWRWSLSLSPFVFQDMSFTYEILSPYVSFDKDWKLGWGLTIMKFSAFFGGV